MENKLALIIGSSGSIGFETAKVLHKKGMKVCLSYHKNEEKLKGRIREAGIKDSGVYRMDMTDEDSIRSSILSILQEHEKIDAVVYCVSSPVINKKVFELTWEDFQEHINIQIKGLFEVIKTLSPLIENNHKIKFVVVLTEYCLGKPPARLAHYIAAKYGLMGFTKSMASELIKYNCTFNMISPGMVDTNLLSNLPPKLIEITAAKNPMGRIAESNDVARVISFLASEESDYLNGVNIPVNGGDVFV